MARATGVGLPFGVGGACDRAATSDAWGEPRSTAPNGSRTVVVVVVVGTVGTGERCPPPKPLVSRGPPDPGAQERPTPSVSAHGAVVVVTSAEAARRGPTGANPTIPTIAAAATIARMTPRAGAGHRRYPASHRTCRPPSCSSRRTTREARPPLPTFARSSPDRPRLVKMMHAHDVK